MRVAAFFVLPFVFVACSSAPSNTPPGADADGGASDAVAEGGTGPHSCEVTSKGTAGVVLQGRLLLPAGPLDGELLIDAAGKIACAAASCAASPGYGQATLVSCAGAVISPGLVNAHDHTNYATQPPIAVGQQRWEHRHGWRTGNGGPKLPGPQSTTNAALIAAAELRFVMSGATSILSSGGVSGLLRNVASFKNPEQLEGLTGKTAYFDTFPLGDSNGTELASGCAYPSVRSAGAAFADGVYAPHVAEGINAAAENEFACVKGALVTSRTAIIHGVGLGAADVATIKAQGALVVWSPRSNIVLYGNTAPVTELAQAGVPLALGTDWLPTGSMNMLRELSCARSLSEKYFAGAFDDRALWTMATKNGSIATGFSDQIGELAVGKYADLAVYDGSSGADYGAVVRAGVEDVRLVMRGGKVLYGDSALTSALATGCADLDVCGQKRQACVDTPGVTLAAIESAVASVYPLFFCKNAVPSGEPSCVPYRDTYPAGTSATDRDGDGVLDSADDCPDVFNPARPMDNGAQADANKNGKGDACDPSPL
jgi:cytosine/adenosine deaminase-related metal-dependent hydrolase